MSLTICLIRSSLVSSLLLCRTTRVEYSGSHKTGASELKKLPPAKLPPPRKETNNKILVEAHSFVNKILLVLVSSSQMERIWYRMVKKLEFYCHTLLNNSRRKADVLGFYITLLDVIRISPTLVLNQNAKVKEIGNLVRVKVWTI